MIGLAPHAQVGAAEVRVPPPNPTTEQEIALGFTGTWTDSCVSKLVGVRISGKHVVIATESPGTGCTPGQRSWKLFGPVGKLPPGPYAVTVTHRCTGLPYKVPEQAIGQGAFQVRSPGCSSGDSLPEVSQEDLGALVQGNTAFALDLYRVLQADRALAGKNLLFSPYSISLALAMAYAGARGETERQMREALRFSLPQDRLHPAFARLTLSLASRRGLELSIANSLWGQTGYPFLPSFLCLVGEVCSTPLREVDFLRDPEGARSTINCRVDQPSLFFTLDRKTGTILFPGRVLDPRG